MNEELPPPQPMDAPGTRPLTDYARVELLMNVILEKLNAEQAEREKKK